jgi:polyisoprenoid-binding protein YceI
MSLVPWEFDHAHSSIDFTVRHLLVSKVRGFKSKRVEDKGNDHLAVTGDLTIRSVSAAASGTSDFAGAHA